MKHFKSLFSSILVVSTILLLGSCNKNNPKSTEWYIYEHYLTQQFSGQPPSIPMQLGSTGLDQILDFRNDGTIYYTMENVSGTSPSFWGNYTDSTITMGTGGANSQVYSIINMDSHLIEAKKTVTQPGVTTVFYLTLKR
jgi:hypothetical protein